MIGNIEIIAEAKEKSPWFKFPYKRDYLLDIAIDIGDMISIPTGQEWGGSLVHITETRKRTDKPILAKNIHPKDRDLEMAFDAGATYGLVVGRIPADKYLGRCMIEPSSLEQLLQIPNDVMVVWNQRDIIQSLKLGYEVRQKGTFQEARAIFDGWLCQASYLKTIEDIKKGADAVLVGTNLVGFATSIGYKIKELK